MSNNHKAEALIIRFPGTNRAERLVLVLTDRTKTGPVDPALEKLGAEHRMYRDGGGCEAGSGKFENYYYGMPADSEAFETAVVAAGFEVRHLAA